MIARNNNINSKEIKYYENNNINQNRNSNTCFTCSRMLPQLPYNQELQSIQWWLPYSIMCKCMHPLLRDRKKREDAEAKNASDNINIR